MEGVPVTNRTMELSDCRSKWTYNGTYHCWCLEDVLYTPRAATPKFQRLSIFVPEPYLAFGGKIMPEGEKEKFTAKTAPVIFDNNSAGYMQMPHTWLGGPRCNAAEYLKHGYIYVTCGNRGSESKDANGNWCGKAPINLIDLKMAIRFLRHNAGSLPGDFNRIVSVGWSAGGAMSALLALTGNNVRYDALLKENGAFMDERDDVYAAQIYCPIIDLEHADLAYEWMFGADRENESSPAGPAGVMGPFEEALSRKLTERYILYFNALQLKDPTTTEVLFLGEDGRSGSGYAYLLGKLGEAASIYLKKLESGELKESYTVKEYLEGEYEYLAQAPMGEKEHEKTSSLLQGHKDVGESYPSPGKESTQEERISEPPSMGELLSRPPKGVPYVGHEPPMVKKKGQPKGDWLFVDGQNAQIKDLDSYVLHHRRRMKPCTSFDKLEMDSGENRLFGTQSQPYQHFDGEVADAIASLKEEFPQEYERYYDGFARAKEDEKLKERMFLLNPLNFIGSEEKSDQAAWFRIRVGASDADTSLSVGMTLACKLAEAGKAVDYSLVWEKPHCQADYPGELCAWIDQICLNGAGEKSEENGTPALFAKADPLQREYGKEMGAGEEKRPDPGMDTPAETGWIKRKVLDLPYASDSPAQRLDIYLPNEGEGPFAALVYFHGGGFAMGDKRDRHLERYLTGLSHGLAVAAVEYRLSGEAKFPAAVLDARSAVRFLKKEGKKYGIDPNRLAAIGGSAGGNLAAMLAMNIPNGQFCGESCKEGEVEPFVQAAVDQYGPINFASMDQQSLKGSPIIHDDADSPESQYLGAAVSEAPSELLQAANPISYLSDAMCPILVQHGTDDLLVPYGQSEEFVSAIREKVGGSAAEFTSLAGAGHDDPLFASEKNLAAVFDFLKRKLE